MSLDVRAAFDMAAAEVGAAPARRETDRGHETDIGHGESGRGRRPISSLSSAETHGAPGASLGSLVSIAGPPAPVRPCMGAVTVTVDAGRYRVQVEIHRDEDRALGLAEGPLLASVARRLVAEATLQALTLFGIGADRAAIDAIGVEPLGSQTVALVTVLIAAGTHEEAHVGAAVVRASGEHDAIARAVLDATNRRLSTRA